MTRENNSGSESLRQFVFEEASPASYTKGLTA